MSLVLCCLSDKAGALSEAWRTLRPGGRALATFPRVGRRFGFRRRSLGVTRERSEGPGGSAPLERVACEIRLVRGAAPLGEARRPVLVLRPREARRSSGLPALVASEPLLESSDVLGISHDQDRIPRVELGGGGRIYQGGVETVRFPAGGPDQEAIRLGPDHSLGIRQGLARYRGGLGEEVFLEVRPERGRCDRLDGVGDLRSERRVGAEPTGHIPG